MFVYIMVTSPKAHKKARTAIHCTGSTAGKPLRAFPAKGLQSAARTNRPPRADNSHTGGLSGIFSDVHAAGENDLTSFAACGRRTLRGIWTCKKPVQRSTARADWLFSCTTRSGGGRSRNGAGILFTSARYRSCSGSQRTPASWSARNRGRYRGRNRRG